MSPQLGLLENYPDRYRQLLKNIERDHEIYIVPPPFAENFEVIQPHTVIQPKLMRRKLPITRSEMYERPKIEHIVKKPLMQFFKLINEIQT